MVGVGPVAALREYLTGDVEGYKRSLGRLDGPAQMELGALLSSAFAEAVERRFGREPAPGEVAAFVDGVWARSPGLGNLIDPKDAERMIRGVFADEDTGDILTGTMVKLHFVLLGELVTARGYDEAGLEEFLATSARAADEFREFVVAEVPEHEFVNTITTIASIDSAVLANTLSGDLRAEILTTTGIFDGLIPPDEAEHLRDRSQGHVTAVHVATLRAHLAGDREEYQRLWATLRQKNEAKYYIDFVCVAFFEAVDRRFGDNGTDAAIIEFIDGIKTRFDEAGEAFDTRAAEMTIRAALDDDAVDGTDSLDGNTLYVTWIIVLTAIIYERHLTDAELDEFLTKARNLANREKAPWR